jgi:hypothetical protein
MKKPSRKPPSPSVASAPLPRYISRHQAAVDWGVTRAAIIRAIRERRFPVGDDDRIDRQDPAYVYCREAARARKGLPGPSAPNPDIVAAGDGKSQGKHSLLGHPSPEREQMPLKQRADIAKIKQQIIALELKNQQARNELVSFDLIHRIFSMWFSVESTELLPLGDRIASEVLAISRITPDDRAATIAIGQLLHNEVTRAIEHIDRLIKDFIKSIPVSDGTEE